MLVEVTRTHRRIVKLRYDNGTLKVVANYFVSQRKIKQIIEENLDWVNKQKEKFDNRQFHVEQIPVSKERVSSVDGGTLARDLCVGRKTLLFGDVVEVMPSTSTKTYIEGDILYINDRAYQNKDLRLKTINAYLKRVAQLYVSSEVSKMGTAISLCPSKIEFKDVSKGWVRCSLATERIFCVDYRISQLPQELRTYIIAHAFAHFVSAQHDDKFWMALASFAPKYESCCEQLKQYEFLKEI